MHFKYTLGEKDFYWMWWATPFAPMAHFPVTCMTDMQLHSHPVTCVVNLACDVLLIRYASLVRRLPGRKVPLIPGLNLQFLPCQPQSKIADNLWPTQPSRFLYHPVGSGHTLSRDTWFTALRKILSKFVPPLGTVLQSQGIFSILFYPLLTFCYQLGILFSKNSLLKLLSSSSVLTGFWLPQ